MVNHTSQACARPARCRRGRPPRLPVSFEGMGRRASRDRATRAATVRSGAERGTSIRIREPGNHGGLPLRVADDGFDRAGFSLDAMPGGRTKPGVPNEANSPGSWRPREIRSTKLEIRDKFEMRLTETDRSAPNEPNFRRFGLKMRVVAKTKPIPVGGRPAIGDFGLPIADSRQWRFGMPGRGMSNEPNWAGSRRARPALQNGRRNAGRLAIGDWGFEAAGAWDVKQSQFPGGQMRDKCFIRRELGQNGRIGGGRKQSQLPSPGLPPPPSRGQACFAPGNDKGAVWQRQAVAYCAACLKTSRYSCGSLKRRLGDGGVVCSIGRTRSAMPRTIPKSSRFEAATRGPAQDCRVASPLAMTGERLCRERRSHATDPAR